MKITEEELISSFIRANSDKIKNFPDDFADLSDASEMKIPKQTLLLGNELFGTHEIITADGTPVLQAESLHKAKYIIYSNRNLPGYIRIPNDEKKITKAVEKYDSYLDTILRRIELEYKIKFPEASNSHSVSNRIFKKLNLVRI